MTLRDRLGINHQASIPVTLSPFCRWVTNIWGLALKATADEKTLKKLSRHAHYILSLPKKSKQKIKICTFFYLDKTKQCAHCLVSSCLVHIKSVHTWSWTSCVLICFPTAGTTSGSHLWDLYARSVHCKHAISLHYPLTSKLEPFCFQADFAFTIVCLLKAYSHTNCTGSPLHSRKILVHAERLILSFCEYGMIPL